MSKIYFSLFILLGCINVQAQDFAPKDFIGTWKITSIEINRKPISIPSADGDYWRWEFSDKRVGYFKNRYAGHPRDTDTYHFEENDQLAAANFKINSPDLASPVYTYHHFTILKKTDKAMELKTTLGKDSEDICEIVFEKATPYSFKEKSLEGKWVSTTKVTLDRKTPLSGKDEITLLLSDGKATFSNGGEEQIFPYAVESDLLILKSSNNEIFEVLEVSKKELKLRKKGGSEEFSLFFKRAK